jgi:hypothetical protein
MLTIFGVVVLTFMMLMYALERRGPGFVLAFALGCALSSTYGFLAGTWPFGVVEAIWTVIAPRRYGSLRGFSELIERCAILFTRTRRWSVAAE